MIIHTATVYWTQTISKTALGLLWFTGLYGKRTLLSQNWFEYVHNWVVYKIEWLVYSMNLWLYDYGYSLKHVGIALGITIVLCVVMYRPRRRNRRYRRYQARERFNAGRRQTIHRHRKWKKEATHFLKVCRKHPVSRTRLQLLLQEMSPYTFEYLIIEAFQAKGFDTRKIMRASGDGGIDGMVMQDGRWHLVQAKRYNAIVSITLVQGFATVCSEKHMPGLFITSSRYSASTQKAFVRHSPQIHLYDLDYLHSLVHP
jgi:restriction system protein